MPKSLSDIQVPEEAYGSGWNGSLEVPTKNAVYDKIETMGGGGDVSGPSSSTDNEVPRFDGTSGKTLQGNTYPVTVSDAGLLQSRFFQTESLSVTGSDPGILSDVINEYTEDEGVTVSGVLIKDGLVDGKDVGSIPNITVSTTAPSSPSVNDLWVDSN